MNRAVWIVTTIVLAVLLVSLVIARRGGDPMAEAGTNEVRVYDVPVHRAADIEAAIRNVLRLGDQAIGSSHPAGPGQIMVLAPASVQAGIRTSLSALGGSAAPSQYGREALTLRLWMLRSSLAHGVDDPALAPIATQLDGLRQELGAGQFLLSDSMRVSLASNADAISAETPRGTLLRVRARSDGEAYLLDLGLDRKEGTRSALNTNASIRAGQTLILSTVAGRERDESEIVVIRLETQSP